MLDAIGIAAGCDKSSLRAHNRCAWDYSRHYEEAFRDFRHEPNNVIEIGVAVGASLEMWLHYFDRAHIIGIDIDPNCARFARGRAEVRIGSQTDEVFLRAIAAEYPPSIVIDDGSHDAADIARSFEILFPLLLPGGIYVIEDLAFHFVGDATNLLPHNPGSALHALLYSLVMAKFAYANTSPPHSEIDEVRLIGGAVLIKKTRARDHEQTRAALQRELERLAISGGHPYAHACFRMAEYLLAYHNAPERSLEYIEKGAVIEPDQVYGLSVRRKALLELGRLEEARPISDRLESVGAPSELPEIVKRDYMKYPHR